MSGGSFASSPAPTVKNNGKSPDFAASLAKPIRDLGLTLEGSPVERFVQRLYRELDAKKLKKFRPPACYLTNEGGCPCGEPIIGIPFYLASVELSQVEKDTNDLEDVREVMMDYGTKRDTTPPCCRACRRS